MDARLLSNGVRPWLDGFLGQAMAGLPKRVGISKIELCEIGNQPAPGTVPQGETNRLPEVVSGPKGHQTHRELAVREPPPKVDPGLRGVIHHPSGVGHDALEASPTRACREIDVASVLRKTPSGEAVELKEDFSAKCQRCARQPIAFDILRSHSVLHCLAGPIAQLDAPTFPVQPASCGNDLTSRGSILDNDGAGKSTVHCEHPLELWDQIR